MDDTDDLQMHIIYMDVVVIKCSLVLHLLCISKNLTFTAAQIATMTVYVTSQHLLETSYIAAMFLDDN